MNFEPSSSRSPARFGWNGFNKAAIQTSGGLLFSETDWTNWLQTVENKRRLLRRRAGKRLMSGDDYFGHATYASFHLEGLDISEREIARALARGEARHMLRTRQVQRIRNHVAILQSIELLLRRKDPLTPAMVLRWYTSISSGLSTTSLDNSAMNRLGQVICRINSPKIRLQAALQDIARLYMQLLSDPLVPGFNGILSRLLLRYQMGRCGFPPVVFDSRIDVRRLQDERMCLASLMQLIDAAYDALLTD